MRRKLLILVVLVAAVLRLIGLGNNPPSLNWDEIAIGWNAYSILQTGKDEFGKYFPLTFRSFDDYKSPAYIYAVIPSIIAFGKTEFAIRFPSALAGILSVILLYPFTRVLLRKRIDNPQENIIWHNRNTNIAVFSAGLLAITPWHVHFSRVAFESNFALCFEILGAWLFLVWIGQTAETTFRRKILILLGSVFAFSVALYSYANARLFIILLLGGWCIPNLKTLFLRKKEVIIGVVTALIIATPLIVQMAEGIGFARYQATAIFNRPEIYQRNKEEAVEDYKQGEGRLSVLVHNSRVPLAKQIIQNYFDHYLYTFLFVKSDLPRHQVPGFGLLYVWMAPLILIGIVFTIKNRKYINAFLPVWWLFVAPIPAALTWQVPHSIRSELMLPILVVFGAVGLWSVLKALQQLDLNSYSRNQNRSSISNLYNMLIWIIPKGSFIAILIVMVMSTYALAMAYHTNLPQEYAKQWLYGRREMVQFIEKEKGRYDNITIDLSIDWAYLWFLWYGNYSPQWYLSQGGTVSGGFAESQNTVGKIQFKKFDFDPIFFSSQKAAPNSLYIGLPDQFPSTLVPYKTIRDPAGKAVIYIVKT